MALTRVTWSWRAASPGGLSLSTTSKLLPSRLVTGTVYGIVFMVSEWKVLRMGDYKLLWGEQPKGNWFTLENGRRGRKLNKKIDWEALQIKLMENQNLIDLEENDWDLEDEKNVPSEDPSANFDKLSRNQPFQLFDLKDDPEERNNIAKENSEIVAIMKGRVREASETMRKGNFEFKSILGHPFMRGGNFMPGWCVPEI